MNIQVERECVKALAYGKTAAEIAAVMNVPLEEVESISSEKVSAERNYLRSMGYIS